MYIYTHTYAFICIHRNTSSYVTHVKSIFIYIYICMYVCIFYVCMYVYMYVCILYIHMHAIRT